ncbi:MAG: AAA family ATPase [Candidatus Micrarchaeota archaeon]|nr:AAA family ATPase [Candidatus Micrarchaeota archaeon]
MEKELLEFSEKAREEGKTYLKKRFIYYSVSPFLKEKVFIGLVGPRGVGKSVILKQLLAELDSAFYLSLDSFVLPTSLYSLAEELQGKGIKYFLLDELQFYPLFEQELKKIHDFLSIKVIFTGSAAVSLSQGAFDLSRRARIISIPPLSFRELIFFEKNVIVKPFLFDQLINQEASRDYYGSVLEYENMFDAYLGGRNYPFTSQKRDFLPLFNNILERIITHDLLKTNHISLEESNHVRNLLKFMGKSSGENVSYSSLATNVGITKYKAEKYVHLLENSFVLNCVFPTGTNVLKEPKIRLSLPYRLLYRNFDECIGDLREDFFVEVLRFSGKEFHYLKTNRGKKTPDYLLNDVVIEIGGKTKGRSQFKGFTANKQLILTHPGTIDKLRRPLFLAGFIEW